MGVIGFDGQILLGDCLTTPGPLTGARSVGSVTVRKTMLEREAGREDSLDTTQKVETESWCSELTVENITQTALSHKKFGVQAKKVRIEAKFTIPGKNFTDKAHA